MQVKDLSAGDNIEVIELTVKNVGQGKFGKPPGNVPYQHCWLTDGTGDIRFSLFGDDVNKLQEGQQIKIISGYIKEYPVGSGKLQLSLGRDGGDWQIVSGNGQPVKRDDIVAAPVQIVSSDTRDRNINRQSARRDAVAFMDGQAAGVGDVLEIAQQFYEWAMGEESLPSKPPAGVPQESPAPTTGPGATRADLIAAAGGREVAGWTGPPTMDLVQKFAATMNGILGGDKERHTWLNWTYGKMSSKDVTGAKLQAVLDMLDPTYENKKWIPTKPEAVMAIKAMFKQALLDAGQTEMSLEQSVEEVYGT